MLINRQLRIIVKYLEVFEYRFKMEKAQENLRNDMKLMVEELQGNIHEYERIIEKQGKLF